MMMLAYCAMSVLINFVITCLLLPIFYDSHKYGFGAPAHIESYTLWLRLRIIPLQFEEPSSFAETSPSFMLLEPFSNTQSPGTKISFNAS